MNFDSTLYPKFQILKTLWSSSKDGFQCSEFRSQIKERNKNYFPFSTA
jgi:hypothetical protein